MSKGNFNGSYYKYNFDCSVELNSFTSQIAAIDSSVQSNIQKWNDDTQNALKKEFQFFLNKMINTV